VGVVWQALRCRPRATEPNPEHGVVEPGFERRSGIIKLVLWTREMRLNCNGANGRKKGSKDTGEAGENEPNCLGRENTTKPENQTAGA
tara:strand:- start:382 stop:645 length:264 start_codon:yes stop_codon:yes gene_type:complete